MLNDYAYSPELARDERPAVRVIASRYDLSAATPLRVTYRPDWATWRVGSIGDSRLIPVDRHAPMPYRKALERLAWSFKRESGYSFVQYEAKRQTDYRGMLWDQGGAVSRLIVVGGCCFDRVFYDDVQWGGWELSWIWLHPFVRRQGYLTRAWPSFRAVAGEFNVQSPFSPAMQQFLTRRGWTPPFQDALDRLLAQRKSAATGGEESGNDQPPATGGNLSGERVEVRG